jgi:hypothetical protein
MHMSVLVPCLVTLHFSFSVKVPGATENKRRPVEVLVTQYSSMCIFRNVSYISTAVHIGSGFFYNIYSKNCTTVEKTVVL